MEKKLYELKIDPELRDLIPSLTDDEYQMLEDSIMRDGCDTPLTVWNGIIVDGHNRYDICHKHSVPFAIDEKEFADKNAAMFWMLEHQLARRNLNSYQRSELVLCFEPLLKERAKQNQGTRNDLDPNFRLNSVGSSTEGYSDHKMAEMAGVGHDTIRKVRTIKNKADDETKQQLRAGKKSIHKAYTEIVNKEHEGETRLCESCHQEKPYSEFDIPSRGHAYRSICKECEEKARLAAKGVAGACSNGETNHHESQKGPNSPSETGIVPVGRGAAHVSIGLPDDPALFEYVIHLVNTAGNAFIANFENTVTQYRPSMICKENTDTLRSLLDAYYDQANAILNTHLTNIVKEED